MLKNKLLAVTVVGFSVGIGLFTFSFADGLSYFSNESQTCVNCHIMQPVYNSWEKSAHRSAATCQQCHISHDLIDQYIQKASQGIRHAYAFTFNESKTNLSITESGLKQTIKNCVECHRDLFSSDSPIHNSNQPQCLMCHRDVHH